MNLSNGGSDFKATINQGKYMSKKILVTELMDVLGVSKTNANAFADKLELKYAIHLDPYVGQDVGSPVAEETISADPLTDENTAAGELNASLSQGDDEDLHSHGNEVDGDEVHDPNFKAPKWNDGFADHPENHDN